MGAIFFLDPQFIRSIDADVSWDLFLWLNQSDLKDPKSIASSLQGYNSKNRQNNKSFSLRACDVTKSLKFIRFFLENETQHKTADESLKLLKKIKKHLYKQESQLHKDFNANQQKCENSAPDSKSISKWFRAIRKELEALWCSHVSEDNMTDDTKDEWGKLYHDNFLPLQPEQPDARIVLMIRWALEKDLGKWKGKKGINNSLLSSYPVSSHCRLWYLSPYKDIWKRAFLNMFNTLPPEERLMVLEKPLEDGVDLRPDDVPDGVPLPEPDAKEKYFNGTKYYFYKVAEEDHLWYDTFLRNLIDTKDLPKDFYLKAVIAGCNRKGFRQEKTFVSYTEKCLGLVRGTLSSKKDIPSPDELEPIWFLLESIEPEKALRHRLMLLRASQISCCDKSLKVDKSSPCPLSANEIINRLKKPTTYKSRELLISGETKFLVEIRRWVAEYYLSRLQLRKKEKAGKDGYLAEQAMEKSPMWRQGYLKALSELGTDLNGRIHKTAFFISKNDPDEDVRAIAKQCYKSNRREHKKKQNMFDIERSLIAAYWWLLLAHKKELGQEIDYDAALLTRRRQLRR